MFLNIGMTNSSIAVTSSSTSIDTTAGYVIADLTLRRSSTCFSIVVASRMEHAVEHTAGLTGAHHRDVEAVERLRVLGERRRQRRALLDVEADLVDDRGERLVLRLLGEDVQRTQQRQAGVDHRRELAREDRDVLQLDPVREERDLELAARGSASPCCSISIGM